MTFDAKSKENTIQNSRRILSKLKGDKPMIIDHTNPVPGSNFKSVNNTPSDKKKQQRIKSLEINTKNQNFLNSQIKAMFSKEQKSNFLQDSFENLA